MSNNKLVTAYTELMEHLYLAMDDTLHTWADSWRIAKDKMHKAGDLTLEEIDIIADALHRDIESAAHGLPEHQDKNTLSQWFKFDVGLIENFALDAFLSLADKTRIQLAKLGEEAKHNHIESGMITMPGTFACEQCNKIIAFKMPSEVPTCPNCQNNHFARI